jgi:hypothetical protein
MTCTDGTVKEPAHDVGGGRLVATVTDPDRNVPGLLQDRWMPTPSRAQRRRGTGHRLTHDIDVWVASASADSAPYRVPLSFDWDGEALLMATPSDSPTGRNLAATRPVRLGLGHTKLVRSSPGDRGRRPR